MTAGYEKFIDADRNRIEWVAVFARFAKIMAELEPLAPRAAERFRQEFYELAAQPLVRPAVGIAVCDDADAELGMVWPLSWDEAVGISIETGDPPWEVAEEHRLASLLQS